MHHPFYANRAHIWIEVLQIWRVDDYMHFLLCYSGIVAVSSACCRHILHDLLHDLHLVLVFAGQLLWAFGLSSLLLTLLSQDKLN